MAVVIGTNAGFVSTAPSADPLGSNSTIDARAIATKDTSPSNAARITSVGWWCDNATGESNFEVGLYAADGTGGAAGTRLFVVSTNAKGTTSGWKTSTGLDWAISASTVYWIAVQLDDTATTTNANRNSSTGIGYQEKTGATTLNNPFGTPDASSTTTTYAIYALVEAGGPTNLKSYNTNTKANIKSINTNPIANVKSLDTNM